MTNNEHKAGCLKLVPVPNHPCTCHPQPKKEKFIPIVTPAFGEVLGEIGAEYHIDQKVPQPSVAEWEKAFYDKFSFIRAIKNERSGNSYTRVADFIRTQISLAYTQGKADERKRVVGICCTTCKNMIELSKSKNYDWAKVKGKEYAYKRSNFKQLCRSCHHKYDMTNEVREKLSATNYRKYLTHCLKGHELTGDNVYLHNGSYKGNPKRIRRACKICRYQKNKEIRLKTRARILAAINNEN